MTEDTDGLARESAAIRAATRAMEPYIDEIRQYREEARSLKDGIKEVRAVREEMQKLHDALRELKSDAAQVAKYAEDDRRRLATSVKEDATEHASDIANEIVAQALKVLQINLDKADDFTRDMQFLRELRETFGVMRRHAITVLIGIIMLGITTGIWQALKSGAKP